MKYSMQRFENPFQSTGQGRKSSNEGGRRVAAPGRILRGQLGSMRRCTSRMLNVRARLMLPGPHRAIDLSGDLLDTHVSSSRDAGI